MGADVTDGMDSISASSARRRMCDLEPCRVETESCRFGIGGTPPPPSPSHPTSKAAGWRLKAVVETVGAVLIRWKGVSSSRLHQKQLSVTSEQKYSANIGLQKTKQVPRHCDEGEAGRLYYATHKFVWVGRSRRCYCYGLRLFVDVVLLLVAVAVYIYKSTIPRFEDEHV